MLNIDSLLLILAQDPKPTGFRDMMFFMALILLAFYFIIIRPQRKTEGDRKRLLTSLEKGDEVQTIGGIVGTVLSIDQQNDIVTIEVDKNSKLRLIRSAVSSVEKKKKRLAKKDESIKK